MHITRLAKSLTVVDDLAPILGISTQDFKKYHMSFHDFEKEKNHVICSAPNTCYTIGITEPGVIAYLDDYWIKEGRKDLNDTIYNVAKWLMPIISIGISFIALWFSTHGGISKQVTR